MDRRITRGRPKKHISPVKKSSPVRRSSPARSKVSPVRRSSRPRSTALGATTNKTTKTTPSPIKELREPKDSEKPSTTRSNLPSTLTTTTASRPPVKSSTSTSSVHSSYSSSTQKTVEIRSSAAIDDKSFHKIHDYLRRSVSKTFGDRSTPRRRDSISPTEDTDSRYSRSASRSVYADKEYSDNDEKKSTIAEDEEEEEEHYESFSTYPPLIRTVMWKSIPREEFGGKLGISLLLVIVPVLVYYLQWTCTKNLCEFKPFNWQSIVDTKHLLENVFNNDAIGAFLTYNLVLFTLSGSVYGIHVCFTRKNIRTEFNFNAIPIAILTILAACLAEYYNYSVADFVLHHYLRFCIYGFILAFLVALWCYYRVNPRDEYSYLAHNQLNIYAKTDSFIIRYGLGRQLNPKWFGFVDYKQAFYRISLITTLIFALSILYKHFTTSVSLPIELQTNGTLIELQTNGTFWKICSHYWEHIDDSVILSSTLLILYLIDAIAGEFCLASSFELREEGIGCLLLLRYFATPYLLSAVAKYYFDHHTYRINNFWAVLGIGALLVIGLLIKRLSSYSKFAFRLNPSNPKFRNYETISTYDDRRLLVSSFWSFVRQPNYLGDIIALIALALPLQYRFAWPPLISIVLIILLILQRATRVNQRNNSEYQYVWERYCSLVPNYIIPKVF